MRNMKNIAITVFLAVTMLFTFNESKAQCPMCKTNVEKAMQDEGNTTGLGLNDGILYLLSIPYIVVGAIGIYWYRNRQNAIKNQKSENP